MDMSALDFHKWYEECRVNLDVHNEAPPKSGPKKRYQPPTIDDDQIEFMYCLVSPYGDD
ncbi:hypothetical protein ACFO25_19950 [Paenactinomyces guangxiensis]|uniref:Uncharacterized protein n=1 Tax=Paenactinomyces guangxiensis TaxID=1490290 RepID=A0A7W1WUD1_9BACL|nr:hypothetical protein [Paenactinomyces guangxiensis]MBA4496225.1 hypothetical protein [Paenactinomyces guangxiensis]MBH8593316.1 hypothetical protein [Paenactinomyces guangxiensis]